MVHVCRTFIQSSRSLLRTKTLALKSVHQSHFLNSSRARLLVSKRYFSLKRKRLAASRRLFAFFKRFFKRFRRSHFTSYRTRELNSFKRIMPSGNIPTPPPFASGTLNIPPKDVNVDKSTLHQAVHFIFSIFTAPIMFPIYAMMFGIQQAKNISLVVIHELSKVVALGWNVVELSMLVTKSANILLFKDGDTKPLMPLMMDVYTKMANTLTNIHALPSTQESGTLMHLMLDRLPKSIWETLLPYPHPFFRGSITQASKTESNDLIVGTDEIPYDRYRPLGPGEKVIVYAQ